MYNKGIRRNISNICFDEIDGQNCSRVLADLTLCRAQGPKDCHMTNFENFQGLQHKFKLDSGACSNLLPLRLYKVPLALRDKFKQEIDLMVKAGILTEVTPEMPTPEWLNSFVIMKKPNGNLRVCLDPTDLSLIHI